MKNLKIKTHCSNYGCNKLFTPTDKYTTTCPDCETVIYQDNDAKRIIDSIKDSLSLKLKVDISCDVW